MAGVNSTDLELNYEKTRALVKSCILAKEPIMIHGMPGIGKSDMIHDIGAELNREVIDIRLSLYESVDIKGYPYLEDNIAGNDGQKALSFAISCDFPRDPKSTAIIFLDEINGALPTTQMASYQLILNRRIGKYKLPNGVAIVAAGNREADKGGTFAMAKPLENRFVHVELKTTWEDWLKWAIINEVPSDIIGYLSKNEAKLNAFDPSKSSRAFATPRSWAKAGKLMKANTDATEEQLKHLVCGCIGVGIGMEFHAFRKIANEIPSAMEILEGKAPKLKKTGSDISYMLITNCLYKLRELHLKDIEAGKTKRFESTDQWVKYANNFFEFLLDNEAKIGIEFLVVPIKVGISNYQLPFKQKSVINMKKVLSKTNDLLNIMNNEEK